jgi:paraquat-inducible protein B
MPSKNTQLKAGLFTLGALVLFAAALALLGGRSFLQTEEEYFLYFEGSVAGLNVGAPVVFRGVPLGKVVSISLVNNQEETVTISVGIDIFETRIMQLNRNGHVSDILRDEMIQNMVRQGLRARIAMTSLLTGQARVELDFFPATRPRYQSSDRAREIPTLSSPLDMFSRALANINIDEIARSLLLALQGFNDIIRSEEMRGSLKGLKTAAEAAAELAASAPELGEGLRRMMSRVDAAAAQLEREIPALGRALETALAGFDKAMGRAEQAFAAGSRMMAPDAVVVRELRDAVKEFSEAAKAVRSLAKSLERNPESLLRGRGGEGRP